MAAVSLPSKILGRKKYKKFGAFFLLKIYFGHLEGLAPLYPLPLATPTFQRLNKLDTGTPMTAYG